MIYMCVISILIEKKQPKTKIIRLSGIKRKHKLIFSTDWIWGFLILLPMGYMSMMRSYEVGSDTNGVYRLIYYGGYAVDNWRPTIYEGAFIQYVKAVYRIFPGFDSLLLISFLVIGCVFIFYFLKNKKDINLCIGLLMFITWIFCPYLNVMRQIIAVSISFVGLNYLEKGKIKISIVIWILACFFHVTSIVMFFYLLPYYLKKSVNKKSIPLIFLLSPIVVLLFTNVVVKLPIFEKFATNVTMFRIESLNAKFFLLPLFILPLIVIFWEQLSIKDDFNYIHICGYLLIFPSVFLSGYLWYAFRIMYYFIPSMTIIMGKLGKCCNSKRTKLIVYAYLIISILISFVYVYVINDTDGIYPFVWR